MNMSNIPISLTYFRILIIPFFIFIFFIPGDFGKWLSCFTFVLAGFTDYLDGKLARKYNEETKLGALLDPIADKIMVTVALVLLIHSKSIKDLTLYAAIIIISREILVSGLREFLDGKLTNLQKKIALVLGYSYIAYEHTHQNKLSKNMLKRDQNWYLYIKLLVRKTSNNFFRGIKHNILNKFYNG